MAKEQFLLVEKYRPQTIAECILPDNLKKTFEGIVERGELPNLLLFGSAGTGKTTVAKALCRELNCDVLVLNGSLGAEESGIDAFRTRVRSFASSVSFSGKRKAVLIDEADYLNPNSSQPALRGLIEEFAKNTAFIFTCNYKNRIIEPIHSRCSVIEFVIPKEEKMKVVSAFLKRVLYIFKQENIQCADKKIVADIIMRYYPDFRRCLNEFQKFIKSSGGEVDVGILSADVNLNLKELQRILKEKNFMDARKWAVEALSEEPSRVFRKIYDALSTMVKPRSIPQVVLLLADYQYKAAFVADQEINLVAFLIDLMVDESIEIL
jgi:DNA polymerase III delta prime subunit